MARTRLTVRPGVALLAAIVACPPAGGLATAARAAANRPAERPAHGDATSAATMDPASAPFGLHKGMTRNEINPKAIERGGGMYYLTTVPRPHPAFESYMVQIGPTTGLCWVKGIGRTIATNVYGTQLQAEFDALREQLAQAYGDHREADGLIPGSIWDEPREWTMGLLKKERLLAAVWNRETGADLRPGLRDVYLTATASSTVEGWLALEYYFDNEEQCQKEIDAAGAAL